MAKGHNVSIIKLLKFTYNHVSIFLIWSSIWRYVVNKFLIFDNILITLIQKVSSYKHIILVPCLLVMWLTCFNFHMHRTDLFLLMNVVYGKIECMNWRWWRQLEGCKSFHISVCHPKMLRQNLTSYYILWKLLKSSVTTNIVVLIRFTNTSFLPNRVFRSFSRHGKNDHLKRAGGDIVQSKATLFFFVVFGISSVL